MAQHEAPQVRALTLAQLNARAQSQIELGRTLFRFVYGADAEWDDETRDNYIADAGDLLATHPHLLPLDQRWDMHV
jgi:hypothetical protein